MIARLHSRVNSVPARNIAQEGVLIGNQRRLEGTLSLLIISHRKGSHFRFVCRGCIAVRHTTQEATHYDMEICGTLSGLYIY